MAQVFKTNVDDVVWEYLKHLNVPITKQSVDDILQSNPYYPSLYSISTTFDKLNVENAAYEMNDEQLDNLQTPFAVYMSGLPTGTDFVLVTSITPQTITVSNKKDKYYKLSRTVFLEHWKKIVFTAESNSKSGEKDFVKNKQQEQKRFWNKLLIASTISLVVLFFGLRSFSTSTSGFQLLVLLGLHSVGAVITSLLLLYETGNASNFVKSVCSISKQTNCDAVLSSRGSKLFGISWAEYGLIYFAGGLFWLLIPPLNIDLKLCYLTLATIPVALYIPYSIYYQYKIVKQWCPLCLGVQVILALELVVSCLSFYFGSHVLIHLPNGFTIEAIVWMLIATILPVSVWFQLKSLLLNAKDYHSYKHSYKRLQYHPDLFSTILQQGKMAPEGWQNLGIIIGNPLATNTILKVCNPYCGPCAKAHSDLEEIIQHNTDYKLRIIFTAENIESSWGYLPARHLATLAQIADATLMKTALDDWYLANDKNYEVFAAKYPIEDTILTERGSNSLKKMSTWCKTAEISGTPTFFINGYKLPDQYSLKELKDIL
jgi:uncharacterized membrane protein